MPVQLRNLFFSFCESWPRYHFKHCPPLFSSTTSVCNSACIDCLADRVPCTRVGFSDMVSQLWNRLDSVLFGPWRTGLALLNQIDTGLDHCPRILLSCFRARTSARSLCCPSFAKPILVSGDLKSVLPIVEQIPCNTASPRQYAR